MTIKWYYLSLLLPLSLLFTACEKMLPDPPLSPEQQLPAKTREGKNTLGCLINGQAYVMCASLLDASEKLGNGSPIRVSAGQQRSFSIYTRDACAEDTAYQYEVFKLSFDLDTNNITSLKYAWYNNYNENERLCRGMKQNFMYYDTLTKDNWVKINRFNKNSRILAGEFAFNLYTKGCSDTIKIRAGRFDVRF